MSDSEQKTWEKYPAALPEHTILAGQYVIQDVLGQGGFGITYLAEDYQLKAKVAVKEFFPDSMVMRHSGNLQVTAYTDGRLENFQYGMQSFLDEARVLAKFQGNSHIVGVRSYFEENGTAYFVMDYIEGKNFKTYIQEHGGKVSWKEAWDIMSPVMQALDTVHREGIIHRDVTPDNIFISENHGVKLLDFGAARYSLGDRSRSLDVVLKAGYAPKEQYTRRGRQGPYTDVYSVAACFYAALCGYLPPESLDRMEEDNLVPLSTRGVKLPEGVEEAILKGLEVRAEDRFQSVGDFWQAIFQAMSVPTPDPNPNPLPPPDPEPTDPHGSWNREEKRVTDGQPTGQDFPSSEKKETRGFLKKYRALVAGVGAFLVLIMLLSMIGRKTTPASAEASQPGTNNSEMTLPTPSEQSGSWSGDNGEVYEGGLQDGIPEGQGTCTYTDGSVYTGNWKNGKRNGYGICVWKNGDEYEGEWLDDEMVVQIQ